MSDSENFRRLTEEFLAFAGRAMPVWATEIGDGRFDHLIADFSEDGIRGAIAKGKGFAQRIRDEVRPEGLSDDEKIDWRLLTDKLDAALQFFEETRPWKKDPTVYVTHLTDAVYSIMVSLHQSASDRIEKGAARLEKIPAALEEARRNLDAPPRESVMTAIEMAQGSLEYFHRVLRDFPKQKSAVLAAWHGFLRFLKGELLPKSGGDPRLGREKYDFLLKRAHLLEWDSRALLELGREAFEKARAEIAAQAARIRPGENWLAVLRGAREQYPSRRKLIPFYRELTAEARAFVAERGLAEVPAEWKLALDETPRYERPVIASACYIPVAMLNPASQGLFFVTPVERSPFFWRTRRALRREHTFSEALLTVVHESFPGHHLQFLHAARHPSKLRRLFYDEYYSEGWAFYVEQMMLEEGFHATPLTQLFQKRNELWRALRVVIDVRLHTDENFSAAEAEEMMRAHLGYDPLYCAREVHRYLLEPTQATSYHVGKQELLRLKAEFARRRGNAYRLADFHNAFLSTGSMPFHHVRQILFT